LEDALRSGCLLPLERRLIVAELTRLPLFGRRE
jgi:hypothetical protein